METNRHRVIRELAEIRAELEELTCRVSEIASALGTPSTPEPQADPPVP